MNASAEVYVVVFQENHVKEPYTVVHPAADFYGFLLQHPHARCRLAGVEDARLRTGIDQCLLVSVRHGGNAAHALHDVEHEEFRLQQAALAPLHAQGNIAGLHVRTVFHVDLHVQFRVEVMEHLFCNFYSGQYAFLLDQQPALAHGVRRYAAERRMVAVADVFAESEFDESVVKFFYR